MTQGHGPSRPTSHWLLALASLLGQSLVQSFQLSSFPVQAHKVAFLDQRMCFCQHSPTHFHLSEAYFCHSLCLPLRWIPLGPDLRKQYQDREAGIFLFPAQPHPPSLAVSISKVIESGSIQFLQILPSIHRAVALTFPQKTHHFLESCSLIILNFFLMFSSF